LRSPKHSMTEVVDPEEEEEGMLLLITTSMFRKQ
jgi:hypothetical protein